MAIQSERVERRSRLALTWPARLMAPPNSSSFSVSVVLPASGCEMIANVRRRSTSAASGVRLAVLGAESAETATFMGGMWQGKQALSRGAKGRTSDALVGGLRRDLSATIGLPQRKGEGRQCHP